MKSKFVLVIKNKWMFGNYACTKVGTKIYLGIKSNARIFYSEAEAEAWAGKNYSKFTAEYL